jgi:hypothetical protein
MRTRLDWAEPRSLTILTLLPPRPRSTHGLVQRFPSRLGFRARVSDTEPTNVITGLSLRGSPLCRMGAERPRSSSLTSYRNCRGMAGAWAVRR